MGYFKFFSKDAQEGKAKKIERKKIKHKWNDVNEPIKFVNQNGKVFCPFCSNPIGDFFVTSNRVSLQDTLYVTSGDRMGAPMPNLVFQGVCTKYSNNPPPCVAVIQLLEWEDVSETKIDNYYALLRKSTIKCVNSTQNITIIHSGQKAVLSSFVPRLEDGPRVVKIEWRGYKFGALREDIMLNHKIELHVNVINCEEGDEITLDVKHSKGRRIKGGASEFQITGKVNQDNQLVFHDFMIESDFKDDNLDFDKIEFYHEDELVQSFVENFGWNYIQNGDSVKIYVNVKIEVDGQVAGYSEDDFKALINAQFKRTLELSSNGKFTGKIFFTGIGTLEPPQIVPYININILEVKTNIAGLNIKNSALINMHRPPEGEKEDFVNQLRETTVHELFHSIRLDHPFDSVQSDDSELQKGSRTKTLYTAESTDPLIYYNIMLYNYAVINGQYVGELWKNKRPEYITMGQLSYILKEIDGQKEGDGCLNKENYINYWADDYGGDVLKLIDD